uniref:Peptidase C1A papain C-terminal domain-containing protein n=1 Tax=Tetranychus urticae TaxID=32264 RepID=T1JR04_TETUR
MIWLYFIDIPNITDIGTHLVSENGSIGKVDFRLTGIRHEVRYASGIHKRLSEKHLGYHNIKIIGFGIENGVHYFLVANSWGTECGEKGLSNTNEEIIY